MKKQHIYDPEDLESLMISKSFDELLEAERDFALRHVDDAKAYTAMRASLLALVGHSKAFQQDFQPPSSQVKSALLDAYRAKHATTKRPLFSLNGITLLFSSLREKQWHPVLGFAMIFLLVASIWFVISDDLTPAQRLADIGERETLQERTIPENTSAAEVTVREDLAPALEERVFSIDDVVEDQEGPTFEDTDNRDLITPELANEVQEPATYAYDYESVTESQAKTSSSVTSSEQRFSETLSQQRITSSESLSNNLAEADIAALSNNVVSNAERLMPVTTMRAVLGEMTAAE